MKISRNIGKSINNSTKNFVNEEVKRKVQNDEDFGFINSKPIQDINRKFFFTFSNGIMSRFHYLVFGRFFVPRNKTFLLLLKNNQVASIVPMSAGSHEVGTGNKKRRIFLSPSKLYTLVLPGAKIKCWIHHVNNIIPYPEEPVFQALEMSRFINAIQINEKDLNEPKLIEAKTKRLIQIIIVGVIVVVIMYSLGMFSAIGDYISNLGQSNSNEIVQTVVEPVKKNTEVIVQNVSKVINNVR